MENNEETPLWRLREFQVPLNLLSLFIFQGLTMQKFVLPIFCPSFDVLRA